MKLALDHAHDGSVREDDPRFGFVGEELGNPHGRASAIAREGLESCLADPTVESVLDAVVDFRPRAFPATITASQKGKKK